MSGHSKWATTKHKKALVDSKRSKAFSKLSNSIAIAARGGKDPASNPTLRDIIGKARTLNMPHENIERAIARGSGQIPGITVQEYLIEAYGPGGVAMLIRAITDNKNRTLGSIKGVLNEHGGRIAEAGSVQWMFSETVCLEVPLGAWRAHPSLALSVIDAGAKEIEEQTEAVIILCTRDAAESIRAALTDAQIPYEQYLEYRPTNPVPIADEEKQRAVNRLAEALDECDDIDDLYLNVAP